MTDDQVSKEVKEVSVTLPCWVWGVDVKRVITLFFRLSFGAALGLFFMAAACVN
jgi:hypothetical protein